MVLQLNFNPQQDQYNVVAIGNTKKFHSSLYNVLMILTRFADKQLKYRFLSKKKKENFTERGS